MSPALRSLSKQLSALLDGDFPGGTYPLVGLAEGFIGYADNEQFAAMTNQDITDAIASLYTTMASGEVEVFSVIDDPDGWETLKQAVAPAD